MERKCIKCDCYLRNFRKLNKIDYETRKYCDKCYKKVMKQKELLEWLKRNVEESKDLNLYS